MIAWIIEETPIQPLLSSMVIGSHLNDFDDFCTNGEYAVPEEKWKTFLAGKSGYKSDVGQATKAKQI